jgi:hypothetical protein
MGLKAESVRNRFQHRQASEEWVLIGTQIQIDMTMTMAPGVAVNNRLSQFISGIFVNDI